MKKLFDKQTKRQKRFCYAPVALQKLSSVKFFIAFLMFISLGTQAQLPCVGVTSSDVVENPSQAANFVCIDAGAGEVLLSDLLNAQPVPGMNKLLPFVGAQINAQFVAIRGILRIDGNAPEYTFAPGSEIIFANENSGITVGSGCTLNLKGVSIHGKQNEMYNQILAEAGSTLIVMDDCSIRDGKKAIAVNRNAITSIVGNRFFQNLVSIQLGGQIQAIPLPQAPLTFPLGGSISGNSFEGGDPLKLPFAGQNSVSAIEINSVDQIAIGLDGGEINEIVSFTTGNAITIRNSDVDVVNSTFRDIGRFATNPEQAGISVYWGGTVSLTGIGIFDSSDFTMDDMNTCVYIDHTSSAAVTLAKFRLFKNGVLSTNNPTILPSKSNITVRSCKFFMTRKSKSGVKVSGYSLNLAKFEVSGCYFESALPKPEPPPASFSPNVAIEVYSQTPFSAGNVLIRANRFFQESASFLGASHFFIAVSLWNLNGGIVEYNIMENRFLLPPDPSGPEPTFTGIDIGNCIGTSILYNNITGTNLIDIVQENGIYVDISNDCIFRCNTISNIISGISFRENCWNSTLFANHFSNNASSGLRLFGIDPNIGQQNTPQRRFNRWIGSGTLEGTIESGVPQNPFDLAAKSQFVIVPFDQTTDYWADPRMINGGSAFNWFIDGPGSLPQTLVCPFFPADPGGDDRSLDYTAQRIVNGDYVPVGGYAANTWDVSFLVYGFLDKNPDYRPATSAAASYYQANYNGNLGKFRRVYDGYLSLTSDLPTSTSSQLLSDLHAVNAVAQHEQNFKKVMRVLLEVSGGTTSTLTEQQNADLTEVANQCRLPGGRAVLIARSALGLPIRNTDVCNAFGGGTEDRSKSVSGSTIQVSVFPNPTKGSFTVQTSSIVENGTARLTNLTGQVLKTWTFTGQTLDVRDTALPAGVYLLEVSDAGLTLHRSKIVITQ